MISSVLDNTKAGCAVGVQAARYFPNVWKKTKAYAHIIKKKHPKGAIIRTYDRTKFNQINLQFENFMHNLPIW